MRNLADNGSRPHGRAGAPKHERRKNKRRELIKKYKNRMIKVTGSRRKQQDYAKGTCRRRRRKMRAGKKHSLIEVHGEKNERYLHVTERGLHPPGPLTI